jgi:predicted dithiol-disulfide oxidoreductase (DUF899 family)
VQLPPIVSTSEWQAAHERLVAKEKAALRASDALAAERRRQPVVEIETTYTFDGEEGRRTLLELFDGRAQLIVYHFMFAPDVHGWPDAGCPGCTMFVDQLTALAHLHARSTSFALISLAPLDALLAYRRRMGWDVPWYSSAGNDFNRDFGLTTDTRETFGLSVFIRDDDRVYRSYFTDRRGVEPIGTVWSLLDRTPLGRQEEWEDSPPGVPQTPAYTWWRRHDEYEEAAR